MFSFINVLKCIQASFFPHLVIVTTAFTSNLDHNQVASERIIEKSEDVRLKFPLQIVSYLLLRVLLLSMSCPTFTIHDYAKN